MARAAASFRVRGLTIANKELKRLGVRMDRAAVKVVNTSTLNVQRNAKRNCPVDEGRLRSSIQLSFVEDNLSGVVGTNVEYAEFVEFGTGRAGSQSDHPPLPNEYRHGPGPGMEAQPYLFPAFFEEEPKFKKNIRRLARKAAEG